MKPFSKWMAVFVSVVLAFGAFAFSGCDGTGNGNTPPAAVHQVYSVALQHNGANVDGQMAVDLSEGSLTLSAKVDKDAEADGTVTYESSVSAVAEISAAGVVTLKSKGETVITATVGGKSHSIVLIVNDDYSSATKYTVTVSGGTAKNADGQVVTSASEGDYLTLVPAMPAHKDFVEWDFGTANDLWVNGNTIKMPAKALTITAEYTDTMYTLNVVGGTVSKANTQTNPDGEDGGHVEGGATVEDLKTSYQFAYGTSITVDALSEPTGKMFVGWDYNVADNRIGEEGVPTYSFEMEGEEMTLTAVFSTVENNILPGSDSRAKFNTNSISGSSCTPINASNPSSDPDLEGLYGYSLVLPATTTKSAAYTENITYSSLDTLSDFQPQTIKVIFKNRGAYPVTVELFCSYFGNLATTGIVTVPAGETVTSIMHANICYASTSSWGFAVREDIGGNSGETVPLDFVVGGANTYPDGYPLMQTTEAAQYVNFGNISTSGISGGRRQKYNDVGGLFYSARTGSVSEGGHFYAPISNLPTYDAANSTMTIYVKVINLVNNAEDTPNAFTLYVSSGSGVVTATSATILATQSVNITKSGEVLLYKLTVPRAANQTTLYVNLTKTTIEPGNKDLNVLMQFAYNNVFGYQES